MYSEYLVVESSQFTPLLSLLCHRQQLSTGGVLFRGCTCVCVSKYDHILKFMNIISHKPVVGILPDVELRCSWGQR